MAIIYVLISLILYNVKTQTYKYPNFKQLGVKLPVKLQQHISAVYNNKLFVFGGRNGSVFDNALSTGFWSLDLAQINLVLNKTSKNDINVTSLNTGVQWQKLTVTNPLYGPSVDGFIRCQHQCTTLIDNYLYIIAPYGKTDSLWSETVYRLDLAQNPPVYAAENDLDFASSTGVSMKEPCITCTSDKQLIYMVGGNKAGSGNANNEFHQYNISSKTWTKLTSMPMNRQSPGCGVSYDNEEIYMFGGRDNCNNVPGCGTTSGSNTIEYYSVSRQTWTHNSVTYPVLTWDLKCVNNLYDETIICAGGLEQITHDNVIIYRTPENNIIQKNTVYLDVVTNSFGLAIYEFVNEGTDQASILLVTGGVDGGSGITVWDSIQYMVIYNVPTLAPTPAPTSNPTAAPSNSPTTPPSMYPSMFPTMPPSITPTFNPTTTETTVIQTRQGTAPDKQTQIWATDPNNYTQMHILIPIICTFIFVSFLL